MIVFYTSVYYAGDCGWLSTLCLFSQSKIELDCYFNIFALDFFLAFDEICVLEKEMYDFCGFDCV